MPTTLKILGGSVLKEGDTEPNFEAQLLDGDNQPVVLDNVTDSDLSFHMRQRGAPSTKIDSDSMTITASDQGKVKYEWADDGSDTDAPGTFDAEVELTDSDGEITTFPGDGYVTIQIKEQLA